MHVYIRHSMIVKTMSWRKHWFYSNAFPFIGFFFFSFKHLLVYVFYLGLSSLCFLQSIELWRSNFYKLFQWQKKSRNHVCMCILDVQWWQWRHHQPKLVDHPLCFHIGFVLSFYFHVGSIKLYEHPYINPMKAPALRKYLNTSFLHYKNTI